MVDTYKTRKRVKSMTKFRVPLEKIIDDSYDIEIGVDLFEKLIEDLEQGIFPKASRYAIITDSNVYDFYVKDFSEKIKKKQSVPVYTYKFPAGEGSKTRETKICLEDKMLTNGFGRDSAIIAIGGGVVSDLAGFLAGTFGRGIPFINYATTLLAAADASIGGKTAVDTPVATNLIGLFNQPKKVYIDLATWKTLPSREVSAGLAETIKHACLGDEQFFIYLEKNIDRVVNEKGELILNYEVIEQIAHKNCQIKYRVVSEDEKETNLRQILNLGHTLGRAIETLCEYRYLHGECVSIGLAYQAFMGMRRDLVTKQQFERIVALLKKAHLPTAIPQELSNQEIIEKMYTDKKVRRGSIYFVLQKGIGTMYSDSGVYGIRYSDEELLQEISAYRQL